MYYIVDMRDIITSLNYFFHFIILQKKSKINCLVVKYNDKL